MTPVRWGLLGAGWIAQRAIVPAIHSLASAQVYAIAARDAERAARLGPLGPIYANYADLVADPNVDAVYIALDNAGHLPWIERSLAAGKPVLCEKPLTMSANQTVGAYATASDHDQMLVEAVWNTWHPRSQRALALVAAGAIGEVLSVRGSFTFEGVAADNYRLDPARGGGAVFDIGCYPLTATAALISAASQTNTVNLLDAVDVLELNKVMSDTGVDLRTDAQLRVGNIDVHVTASFIDAPQQELTVTGTLGVLSLDGDAFTSHLAPSTLTWGPAAAPTVEHFAPVDAYALMIDNVSSAIGALRDHGGRHAPAHWLPNPDWTRWTARVMDQLLPPRA